MRKVLVLAAAVLLLAGCGDDSGSDSNGGVIPDPGTPGGDMMPPGTPGGDTMPDPGTPGGDTMPDPGPPGGDTMPDPGTPGGDTMPDPGTPGGDSGAPAPEPADDAVPGCEIADTSSATLHADAAAILATETPCGFSSCHTGNGKAGLILHEVADLSTQLVGVTSCEAPNVPLVDGQGGDAGLNNSWLWLKLTAAAVPGGMLTPDTTWGEPGNCGQDVGSYGGRMPLAGSPDVPGEERLGPIRNWICAGAPGP